MLGACFGKEYISEVPQVTEIDVFYPIEGIVHMTTSLCYADSGESVDILTKSKMLNLMKLARFQEVPAKEFIASDK